jgi:Xaa-Pro aminopeptidase
MQASLDSPAVFDYAERQRRLAERMAEDDVEVVFLAPSADLEYLTGIERQIPTFGEASYANGWVTGAFFRRDRDPVFVFPRMFAAFDLREEPAGEVVVVSETDDGYSMFERVTRGFASTGSVAVGDRVWAETTLNLSRIFGLDRLRTGSTIVNELRRVKTPDELEAMGCAIQAGEEAMTAVTPLVDAGTTMAELAEAVDHELRAAGSRTPSFTTHIFTGLGEDDLDSGTETAHTPLREGTAVMFDFGGVVDGYCSDFGRTIYCGDPPDDYRDAYEVMLAAQEAGRGAVAAGTVASAVNAACRAPIEEAGLGEHFRHRMGHGIGLDVHERPFLSPEDETTLEPGMTFTDEPSIIIPGRFSVRIEDIVVCDEGGGRKLGSYPAALVANA